MTCECEHCIMWRDNCKIIFAKKVKGGPENGLENGKRKPDNR